MTKPPRRSLCFRLTQGTMLGAIALALGLCAAEPARAQNISDSFGGFSKNSDEPIDIESDVLVVHDAKKYATFKGNVKAVQGTTTLRARELDVHYVGSGSDSLSRGSAPGASADAGTTATDSTPGAGNSGTQINQIEARGDVIITSEQDQTTTSDWALYDVPTQMVTVGGNVVLMQGKNVLKGDRLIIDLKTGESRFENRGDAAAGGRIRALFMPKQDAKSGDKTDNDKAGNDKSRDESANKKKAAESKPANAAGSPADSEPLPLLPDERR